MKKILVVDDNVVNLKFVDKMLKINEDYKPVLVPSGSKALQFLSKNVPDLILLDILMPDMDGFEVLEKIRELPELAKVPVLFLTAEEDAGLQQRIDQAGAQGVLLKPFKQAELLGLVGQYLA
ncbi:response regulator [uncultured Anaerovibrio sp.]|uniref:response regulator n=1 Tax=uncultured Anaerovibrio sp. TaxID=361586 RepID=UPI002610C00A|nr:response regulator [uncultured Anaerovibrio sp.]